jgi:hypothetical protein
MFQILIKIFKIVITIKIMIIKMKNKLKKIKKVINILLKDLEKTFYLMYNLEIRWQKLVKMKNKIKL